MSDFVFLDSFDRWSTQDDCGGKWNQVAGITQTAIKRTGDRAFYTGPGGYIIKNYTGTTLTTGSAVYPVQNTAGSQEFLKITFRADFEQFDSHGNVINVTHSFGSLSYMFYFGEEKLRAKMNYFDFMGGNVYTEDLFDNSQTIYLDEWSHVQFSTILAYTEDHVTADCSAWLNEISQGSQTLDWKLSSVMIAEGWEISDLYILNFAIVSTWGHLYIDDFYATDDGLISGDLEIMVLEPEEDVLAQWTPIGSPDHFDCVNDTLPDGDSTYVYSNTLDNRELYVMEDTFLPSGTDIQGAQGVMYCKKNLPGTGIMQMDWRFLGHSDVNVNVGSPGTTYTCRLKAYSRHPVTDTVMTSDEIDDLQMGFTKK